MRPCVGQQTKCLTPADLRHLQDGKEVNIDCGGECALCPPLELAAHCYNGVQDGGEVMVDIGGLDCLPPFCFDSRLKGDKEDVLRNCGGSCQPCNPRVVAESM
jgi:hypothetical protein